MIEDHAAEERQRVVLDVAGLQRASRRLLCNWTTLPTPLTVPSMRVTSTNLHSALASAERAADHRGAVDLVDPILVEQRVVESAEARGEALGNLGRADVEEVGQCDAGRRGEDRHRHQRCLRALPSAARERETGKTGARNSLKRSPHSQPSGSPT